MNVEKINNEEWKGTHKFLAEGLLVPNLDKTDSNRLQMFNGHLSQCIQIDGAEPPLIFTNFEDQIGDNCLGYKMVKEEVTVLKKIIKNKYNYILITLNEKTNEVDMIWRNEAIHLTEHYGYKNKNELIDSIEEGDILEPDDILFRNYNYDDNMNFTYGTNLNSIYLATKGYTNEDGLVISKSTSEKLSTNFIYDFSISVNDNDFLLNLYGDNNNYKCFPDIGEHIINNKILARRRIVLKDIINSFKYIDETLPGDTIYYGSGEVVDYDVYFNGNMVELEKQMYNSQVYDIIKNQNRFYQEYVDFVHYYLSNNTEENRSGKFICSSDLIYHYNRYKTFLDPKTKYNNKGNDFSNYIINLMVSHKTPMSVGSKLTGRFGNKGVVSLILPDDEMPEIETIDGKPVTDEIRKKLNLKTDICINPSGVVNRLNPSQLFESEINFISKSIRLRLYEMLKENKIKESENYLIEYVSDISKSEGECLKDFFKDLDNIEKLELLNEFIETGIPIHQEPFWNTMDIGKLEELYDKYDVPLMDFKNIENGLIQSEIYYIRLKHESKEKMSIRSIGSNDMKGLPSKDSNSKEHKAPFHSTPIRLGRDEHTNLLYGASMEDIRDLVDAYANNPTDRTNLVRSQITSNPFDIDFKNSNTESINKKILNSLLASSGVKLVDNSDDNN